MTGHGHLGPKLEKEGKLLSKLSLLFNYYNMEIFFCMVHLFPCHFYLSDSEFVT